MNRWLSLLFVLSCIGIMAVIFFFQKNPVLSVRPAVHDEPAREVPDEVRDPVSANVGDTNTIVSASVPLSTNQASKAVFDKAKLKSKDKVPGEYIARFFDRADMEKFIQVAEKKGAKVLGKLDQFNAVRIKTDSPEQFRDIIEEGPLPTDYSANYRVKVPVVPQQPDDADRIYMEFGSSVNEWLGVPKDNSAWGKGLTVAVLDTGVARHTALDEGKISRMDMTDPENGDGLDMSGHGTAVASLIIGKQDDISGIAPSAKVLSIKVLDDNGEGDAFTVAQGIVEAVNRGAQIINLSLGGYDDSSVLRNAVKYAQDRGAIVVAAVGNDQLVGTAFPSAYDGVVGVTSVDAYNQRMYFANVGEGVKISAPGYEINSAGTNNSTSTFSGTSASTPIVSGAVAGLLSENPGMSSKDIVALLSKYADDSGYPDRDDEFGDGILDIGRVEDRNIKGIYDAALSGVRIDEVKKTAIISVQNRGTEAIPSASLGAILNTQKQVVSLKNIQPNQTVSQTFNLGKEYSSSNSYVITAIVSIDGYKDACPDNNSRRWIQVGK